MNKEDNIDELWNMSSEDFNNWRRQNDLPKLLLFFNEYLPFFKEWQKDNGISNDYFLLSDNTSEFFDGNGELALYHFKDKWGNAGVPTHIGTYKSYLNSKKFWQDRGEDKNIEYKLYTKFLPYFYWLKTIKKIKYFELKGCPNSNFISDLTYRGREGRYGVSRAKLLGSFKVLKLGNTITTKNKLINKNLDFIDIDDLTITGDDGSQGRYTNFVYSSCNNVKFENIDTAFFNFKKSHIDDLTIVNSKIQDLHFIDNYGTGINNIENSKIRNISFDNCCLIGKGTDLNRVNITNLEFNFNGISFITKKDFFRAMRTTFQQFGYTHKVQEYFFLERINLMLSHLSIQNSDFTFPPIYRHDLGDLIHKIKIGYPGYKINNILKLTFISLISYLKILFVPKYLFHYIKLKLKFIFELLSYLIWGFGEKPIRIIFSMIFIICGFGLYYYNYSGINFLNGNIFDAIKYSIFVFTTIGYGDFTDITKISTAIAIESFLGITFFGLFISTLVNKVRY